MRSNDKFLSTFLALALSFVFLIFFPALSSLDKDEDKVKKFEITLASLGRTGLAYKSLKNILGDSGAHGASVNTAGRASLKITDKDKFKKTFRDLHLSVLHSIDKNQSGLLGCMKLDRFGAFEDGDMRRLRINGAYLFNITSQRAIAKAFQDDDKGLLEMLNTTVDTLKLYSMLKHSPGVIRTVQEFIDSESDAQGAGTLAGLQPTHPESDDAASRERIRKLRALDEKLNVELADVKAALKVSSETVKQQAGTIGSYQSFQTVLNSILHLKGIDTDQFGERMDEKDGEGIRNLLSDRFEGLSLDDLIEELYGNWAEEGDAGDEQRDEHGDDHGNEGGEDGARPDKDGVQTQGVLERENISRGAVAEEGDLRKKIETQKAELLDMKAALKVSSETVKQQAGTIGSYQSFQTVLNSILHLKGIDTDQFGERMDEKDGEGIRDLLSDHFEGLPLDDLIEELHGNWAEEGDAGDEQRDGHGDDHGDQLSQ